MARRKIEKIPGGPLKVIVIHPPVRQRPENSGKGKGIINPSFLEVFVQAGSLCHVLALEKHNKNGVKARTLTTRNDSS